MEPDAQRHSQANLQREVDNASVYEAMAASDSDEKLAAVYASLAEESRRHAGRAGPSGSAGRPSARARTLVWLARRFGPGLVLPAVARSQARRSGAGDRPAGAASAGLAADESSHARVVQAAARQVGGLPGQTLARLEGRHSGGGGNALRAAVLGANDGLVSNLSLVMGVAGAAANSRTILITGLAGLVAGACSMAMGEWLSVNSAREMAQRQIDAESAELDAQPQMEKEELTLIYQAKGLDETAARTTAENIFQSREAALDTLAREELGVDPEELGGSPWAAAISSFCLFAVGAIFPVIAYAFTGGWTAVAISVGLSGVALVAIGAVTTLFTGRTLMFSTLRQLGIGYGAAGITFVVGRLLGVAVAG